MGQSIMQMDPVALADIKSEGYMAVAKTGRNGRVALSELASAGDIGKILNGGSLTSAASVDVPNNAVSTLSSSESTLTLNVNVGASEVPNFAVEITAGANITLTVTKTVNNVATTLNYSAAAGNSLESGKLYQVTCVGSCWTLAEFTVPTP